MAKYQIVELAKDLAGASYENDFNTYGERYSERFRKIFPTVEVFIQRCWTQYLEAARQTQITMLAAPDSAIPPEVKEKIYEDLMAYEERRRKQRPAKPGRGRLTLRPDQPGTLEQKVFWKN